VAQTGCEYFIIAAAAGSVFFFVKGGIQEVITNGSRVCRWAVWFGVMTTIKAGMKRTRQVQDPLNIAAAWGAANALFSVHQGKRAAVREGLKGAAYSMITGLAVGSIMFLFQSPESSD
jgi:hypothetical protein